MFQSTCSERGQRPSEQVATVTETEFLGPSKILVGRTIRVVVSTSHVHPIQRPGMNYETARTAMPFHTLLVKVGFSVSFPLSSIIVAHDVEPTAVAPSPHLH